MAVMQAWFDDMMIKPSSIVTPLADPTRAFTAALDLEMEGTPPQLGYVRSKRFAAVFDDGKCTNLAVGVSIPAGTTLVREFPNELVDMPARLAGKKTIVVGLPGAFTPT